MWGVGARGAQLAVPSSISQHRVVTAILSTTPSSCLNTETSLSSPQSALGMGTWSPPAPGAGGVVVPGFP